MNTTGLDASQPDLQESQCRDTFYANTHAVLADSNYAWTARTFSITRLWGQHLQPSKLPATSRLRQFGTTRGCYTFNDSDATTYVTLRSPWLRSGRKIRSRGQLHCDGPGVVNGMTTADFTSLSDDLLLAFEWDGSATPRSGDWDGISLIPRMGRRLL